VGLAVAIFLPANPVPAADAEVVPAATARGALDTAG